ncbi:DNA invertase Pin-like site-specific DNA recombinase [Leifsonia sp. EB34]
MAQGQVTDRQEDALREAGVDEIYVDRISGMKSSRPALDQLLDDVRPGDTIVVMSLDRLGRDTRQLLVWVDELRQRQVELQILQLGVDTATPAGRMVFSIVAALAEMERAIIVQRVNEGLAAGRAGGRPPALSPAQRREVIRLRAEGRTAGEIAGLFGCSALTVRRVR